MSADRTAEFVALERRVIDLELAVRILLGILDESVELLENVDDLSAAERAAVTHVNTRGFAQSRHDLDHQEGTAHA